MNLTYLWCRRAVSCKSLLSSARPALCAGREGSTCQGLLWQRRQLRWPTMRRRSCGCGDTRGKTKRRFSRKVEKQEPQDRSHWQNRVFPHTSHLPLPRDRDNGRYQARENKRHGIFLHTWCFIGNNVLHSSEVLQRDHFPWDRCGRQSVLSH